MARQVKSHAAGRADLQFVPFDSPDIDLLLILCGCLRACADKDEIKAAAKRHVMTAGQSLAGTPQNEERLAVLLAAEIDRLSPPTK